MYAGSVSFLGLGLEDGHFPNFWILLQDYWSTILAIPEANMSQLRYALLVSALCHDMGHFGKSGP